MTWQDSVIEALRKHQCRIFSYVGDKVLASVITRLEDDPDVKVVPATREDEAIGIVTGAYLCKARGAVFMQSSGLGNSINALGSVNIASRIPVPLFITLRGDLADGVMAQAPVGRAVRGILQAMNIPYFELEREDEVFRVADGALVTCYGTHQPVAVLVTTKVSLGKSP